MRQQAQAVHFPIPTLLSLQIFFSDDLWVPLVVVEGVYVLPGIPRLFKQMLEANVDTLPRCRHGAPCPLQSMYLR